MFSHVLIAILLFTISNIVRAIPSNSNSTIWGSPSSIAASARSGTSTSSFQSTTKSTTSDHISLSTSGSAASKPTTSFKLSSSLRSGTSKSTISILTTPSHTSESTTSISISTSSISVSPTSEADSSTTATSAAPSWARSCLYDPIADGGDCNRPGDPVWAGAVNPYETSIFRSNIVPPNPSLASYCSSMFMSAESLWLSTAAITSTTYPGFTNIDPEEGPSTTISVGYTEAYYNEGWTFTAATPCCLNCTLFGGNVQVYYWPTSAPSPPISQLVNAAGFTFVSPSVYVAFQSLYATDLCGAVGPTYKSTTLAFDPNELYTAMAWDTSPDDGSLPWDPYIPDDFSLADFSGEKNCSNITTVIYQGDGSAYYSNEAAATSAIGTDWNYEINWWTITYNPCSPTLSVPTQLFSINSMWTGCMQGIDAFYDPPYALSSGSGLKPFSTTADPSYNVPAKATPSPSVAATARPTPQPATASSTVSSTATTDPKLNSPDEPTVSSPNKEPPSSSSSDPSPNTANQDPPPPSPSVSVTNDPLATANNNPVTNTAQRDPPPSSLPTPANDDPAQATTNDPPASTNNNPPAPSIPQDPKNSPSQSPNNDPPQNTANSSPQSPSGAPNHNPSPPSPTPSNDPPLSPSTPATTTAIPTISNSAITANLPSPFIIGGITLTPGDQATISGTTYSLFSNGLALAIGTSTTSLLTTPQPTVGEYIIGSQTLVAGGPVITVSGTAFILMPGGQSVVQDGNTEAASFIFSGGATETGSVSQGGLGGIIVSVGGFHLPGGDTATSYVQYGGGNYSGVVYTSQAARGGSGCNILLVGIMLAVGIVLVGML